MSYFYKFGYGTCEEHGEITLVHEKLFTTEEIEQIAHDAYVYAFKNTKDKTYDHQKTFSSLFHGELDFDEDGEDITGNHFLNYLTDLGFKKFEIQAEAWVFGWAKADEEGDWGSYTQEGDLTRRVQKTLSGNTND